MAKETVIITSYRHIEFYMGTCEEEERDNVWYCTDHSRGGAKEDLGKVSFSTTLKKKGCWVWEQEPDVIFSISCLNDVVSFMSQLR